MRNTVVCHQHSSGKGWQNRLIADYSGAVCTKEQKQHMYISQTLKSTSPNGPLFSLSVSCNRVPSSLGPWVAARMGNCELLKTVPCSALNKALNIAKSDSMSLISPGTQKKIPRGESASGRLSQFSHMLQVSVFLVSLDTSFFALLRHSWRGDFFKNILSFHMIWRN